MVPCVLYCPSSCARTCASLRAAVCPILKLLSLITNMAARVVGTQVESKRAPQVTGMSAYSIRLFGKLEIKRVEQAVVSGHSCKVQELLCYLLLNRERAHPRESLAALLWGNLSTAQSKKYLRQALWQLQGMLDPQNSEPEDMFLLVEPDWVRIKQGTGLWLDVAEFGHACALTAGIPGQLLEPGQAHMLKEAVGLYRGDLLEGWYQDWCLFERERLQNSYLSLLDKLMDYHAERTEYEAAILYGCRILELDRARERTHLRLMRLFYLADDRAAALRQYERCVEALADELAVAPSRRTVELYERIRDDTLESYDLALWPPAVNRNASALVGAFGPALPVPSVLQPTGAGPAQQLTELLSYLQDLQNGLTLIQYRIDEQIKLLQASTNVDKAHADGKVASSAVS